jgi:hypothetical protein
MMARFFLNRRSFFIGRKKVGKNDSIFLKANNIFSNQTRSSLFSTNIFTASKKLLEK